MIDSEESLDDAEEIRYELPLRGRRWEERPFVKREPFALGSAIYETMAWKMPYDTLQDDEVERKYAEENFPDIKDLLVGSVIRDCWNERLKRAEDVGCALEAFATTLKAVNGVKCEPKGTWNSGATDYMYPIRANASEQS